MNNIYRYKIPLISVLVNSYAIVIALGALFFPILIALKYGLKDTSIFIFIFITIAAIVVVPFSIFISINEIHDFFENRRNPNIIVNNESILLPFEDDKKRVEMFFENIDVCKENFTSHKNEKHFFIYISQKKNHKEDKVQFLKFILSANRVSHSSMLLATSVPCSRIVVGVVQQS